MKAQVGIEYYLELSHKNPVSDLWESVWNLSSPDICQLHIETFRTNLEEWIITNCM